MDKSEYIYAELHKLFSKDCSPGETINYISSFIMSILFHNDVSSEDFGKLLKTMRDSYEEQYEELKHEQRQG